jgi:predicted ATP-grasp superfamily ATP-dependent carboligase
MMGRGARILVLDGETTQALATVRSLGRAGHTLFVASLLPRSLATWSRFCVESVRIERLDVAGFATLRRWAEARGVRVVLPLTERACVLLNHEAAAWRDAGIVIGCGPDSMLRAAFDKAETLVRAAACGIAVPATRLPKSLEGFREAARELRPPWVIKPRTSNAWQRGRFLPDRGVAYVDRLEDLDDVVLSRRQGDDWPIIQEFVRGIGKGVFALGDRGEVALWFAHERLRDVRPSGSGSSLRRSVALDPRLRVAAAALLRELKWHGPAMLEFRDDGVHPPWLIEMNGRFWGSLQLAIAAGADFPRQWVRMLLGKSPEYTTPHREGVIMRWDWGDVKRLVHLLKGPPPGYPDPYPGVASGLRELLGRQPPGTRHETWDGADPWPAFAEWLQGLRVEVAPRLLHPRTAPLMRRAAS